MDLFRQLCRLLPPSHQSRIRIPLQSRIRILLPHLLFLPPLTLCLFLPPFGLLYFPLYLVIPEKTQNLQPVHKNVVAFSPQVLF